VENTLILRGFGKCDTWGRAFLRGLSGIPIPKWALKAFL